MTRGNQRELARAKNLKKAKEPSGNKEGLSKTQRQERDAQIMREKLAKSKAKAGGGEDK
jgi:hypothetical protein